MKTTLGGEDLYRSFFIDSKDGCFILGRKGKVVDVNDALLELSGYTREELLKMDVRELFLNPFQKEEFEKEIVEKGFARDFRAEFIRKDGGIRECLITATVRKDEKGRLIGFKGMIRDITEKMEAERKIRESESFLKSIFASIQDGISILDKDLNIVMVNPSMEKWYAESMPIVGKKCYEVYHFRSTPCDVCPTQRTLKTGKPDYEIIVERNPDGSVRRWVDLYTFPMFNEETGEVERVVEYVRDVTERVKTEEKVRKSEENYRTLFESTQDGLFVIDRETGKVVFANTSLAKMFGFHSAKDVIGLDPLDFIPEKDKKRVKKIIVEDMFENDLREINVLKAITKDGREIWLSAVGVRTEYQGKVAGLISIRDITEQKRAEERFRLAAEAVSDLIYEWDVRTDKLEWFGGVDEVLGYQPGEIPRTINGWFNLIHPDDLERLKESVEIHRNSTKLIQEEYRVRHKDGSWRYWVDRGLPVLDENGKPYKWVGACVDITEQKKAEEKIRESEEKFKELFESSKDMIYITSREGIMVDINHAGVELLGYTKKEEVIGTNVRHHYLNPEDRKRFVKEIEKNGFVKDFETRLKKKDGSVIDCLITSTVRKDEKGKIIGYQGIVRDITQQKKLQRELDESEMKYRTLVEYSPDGVLIIQNNKIVYSNPAFYGITDFKKKELWSIDHILEAADEESRAIIKKEIEKRKRKDEGAPFRHEFRFRKRNGQFIYVEVSGAPIIYKGKSAYQLTVRDITARKEFEKKLMNLVINVTHLINTPLTVVLGHVDLIVEGLKEATVDTLKVVHNKVKEIEELIRGKFYKEYEKLLKETYDGWHPVIKAEEDDYLNLKRED